MSRENLDPPEPKYPPNGDATIYVERPIPVVISASALELVDRDPAQLDLETLFNFDGFAEFAVLVSFDEGRVFSAEVFDEETGRSLGPIELTADERETAEVNWSEDCAAYPDERDDGDRDPDR